VRVRALASSDAIAVAQLWLAGAHESAAIDQAFSPRMSAAHYAASISAELEAKAILGWGALSATSALLGYITARLVEPSVEFQQPSYMYILDLDVQSESRRQGIGTRLVQAARSHCSASGVASVEVGWLSADARASAFWRKQGFVQYFARARGSASLQEGESAA
jgi:ribosomal protein S18 acetylase RimI-like enzyme